MRKWINLFENMEAPEAKKLIIAYGGTKTSFRKIPKAAQKAIEYYMTVDGDNDEYKKYSYLYAEIPTDIFMQHYWKHIISFDSSAMEDYPSAEDMIKGYKTETIDGYDYSKHNLNEPWPVILGTDFFEDGAHRLSWYVYNNFDKIPAIMIY
jgi:hypothetical protein